jgi:hypothetical protein
MDDITGLAASIDELGLLHPIVVRGPLGVALDRIDEVRR